MSNDRLFLPKILHLLLRPQLLLQEVGIPRAMLNILLFVPLSQKRTVVSGSACEMMLLQWVSVFCTSLFHGALSSTVLKDFFLFSSSFPDWNINVSLDAETSAPV